MVGAVTAAVAARNSLVQEGRDYASRALLTAGREPGPNPRAQLRAMADVLRRDRRLEVSLRSIQEAPNWTPQTRRPVPESLLSLWPWTDPASRKPVFQTMEIGGSGADVPILVVSNRLRYEQQRLNVTVRLLAGAVVLMTGLVAGVTWFVAGRVLRPVEAIRTQFAELTAHHLDRRVPVPRTRDEISRLAGTMNATLDRLQRSVDQQRRFVGDASHELRGPLAALRAELEIALAHPGDADWAAVVEAALGDTRRLQRLTTDLLLLARLDATASAGLPGRRPVVLGALVHDEIRRRRPPDHLSLRVTAEERITVYGHHSLLARLLGNLLDNAERHAAGCVAVSLTHDADRRVALLHVQDDGPGIPPADRRRVFERFTRLDDARTRDTGGTGLGLAIAHHIASAHRGTLEITDSPRGARFTITLPTDV
ncbi:cell wall metabolism sensor histidine kinase WalK [Streptomyces sp. ISL-11]|uniref:sensor histidine kinase n=1 Tax=Streptomyces sp. ISL-11 TaxID=2819174 RepID=UPI001BE9E53E|nr:HAMP domain-containing sensor histidine kinase [Streptomyces sp. ISL-11]MBT2384604.1 HAMP domain-containing histidine kinase [Streptomyces sp. ISL-11]